MAVPNGAYHDSEPTRTGLRFQILGPLRVWREGVEVSAGPRQQAHLLAVLLAREGRPTSTSELIDLIWDDEAPASAVNVIHKYIGALRRLLEPTLRTRGAGSYLLRRANGYLCAAGPGSLDLSDFRRLVASASVQMEERRSDAALDLLIEALALWQGPAGDGIDLASRAIFDTLNAEFCDTAATAAELAVTLGRPACVLAPLRLAAAMAPFHEPVQAGLVTALGADGQQAAALSLFRVVRTRLAEDLGIEPGHALTEAHQRVLRQDLGPPVHSAGEVSPAPRQVPVPAPSQTGDAPARRLVGRTEELAVLRQAVKRAQGGECGLAVLEGEPGVGKTALLEHITEKACQDGALVVWSHCQDGDAPSMWPWVQVVEAVSRRLAPAAKDEWFAGELGVLIAPLGEMQEGRTKPDNISQFRLFEKVATLLDEVAAQRPLILVFDDLQWADTASLRLLAYLVSRIPKGALILAALRDRAPTPDGELAKTLAAMSRVPGHRRLPVSPLSLSEVAELIRLETGHRPSAATVRSVFARTDGNPFFVQELSRLLSGDGELDESLAGQPEVPSTVRDVVLDLVSGLDAAAEELLQLAALIGRHVDLGLLARAAHLDIQTCLGHLEAVEALGLLSSGTGDPFSRRFVHDLVRESISATIPPQRTMRLHLRIADALHDESVADSGVERLAHHLWLAGPLGDPTRTIPVLIRAGRRAAAKTALDTAERALRSAVQVAQTANLVELELAALSELITVVGMSSPHGVAAMELLERAEALAHSTGRHEEAAVLLYSRWMALAYSAQYSRGETIARRLLEQGNASGITVVRALGLQAWGLQQAAVGNIGDAYRYLSEASHSLLIVPAPREDDVVWYAQQLSALGLLAEMTAVHGDVAGAHDLLDRLEVIAGEDPFKITVWATHSVRIASVVGDADWALAVTKKGIAADPDLSFGFFGMYQRLARSWALAMAGRDSSDSAAQVQRLITEHLLDPPRSDIATWYGLLAEIRLSEGAFEEAAAALDLADDALDKYGQRYSEGLILLMRARLLHAQHQPLSEIKRAAESARNLSVSREAHLFAHRADAFLQSLDSEAKTPVLAAVAPLHARARYRRPHHSPSGTSAAE